MAGDLIALCGAVLGASLLGSLHCAGMCGGLVAFAAGAGAEGPRRARFARHVAYHGGRHFLHRVEQLLGRLTSQQLRRVPPYQFGEVGDDHGGAVDRGCSCRGRS